MNWLRNLAESGIVKRARRRVANSTHNLRLLFTILLLFCGIPAGEVIALLQGEVKSPQSKTESETESQDQFVAIAIFQDVESGKPTDPARQKRIAGLIADLHNVQLARDKSNDWMIAVRELTKIGDDAVVPLIEAFDQTNDDKSVRAIAFTLRAIGDPRAVPALIRKIPNCIREAGSDYGVNCDDADLLQFMQEHDNSPIDRDDRFSFGRPINEVRTALSKITGTDQGDDEFVFSFLAGSEIQQWHQRKQFHDLAVRWTEWWKKNWSITMDPRYKEVNLPPFILPPPEIIHQDNPFPVGALVKLDGGSSGSIIEPIQSAEHACLVDLDTGRRSVNFNAYFPKGTMDYTRYIKEHRDDFLAAVAKDGFDLLGIRTKVPGIDAEQFVAVPLGGRFWGIENDRYENLGKEILEGDPLELGNLENQFLLAFDSKKEVYSSGERATFLFETREGGTGVIQITEQISRRITWEEWVEKGRGKIPKGSGPELGVKYSRRYIYRSTPDQIELEGSLPSSRL